MTVLIRILAMLTGGVVLGVATWALVDGHNLHGPHAALVAAMATGLFVGAIVIGRASRKWGALLTLAMIAGEAFAFIGTAERIVVARERDQAIILAKADARGRAADRVVKAEASLSRSFSSPRLETALRAKSEADRVAQEKAAERGCAANCRVLLEQQVASAAAEVEVARSEVAAVKARADAELIEARAALAAVPTTQSATPLADRIGMAPWVLDLVSAALLAFGANGLAVLLIAWGSHAEKANAGGAIEAVPVRAVPESSATFEPAQVVLDNVTALPSPSDADVSEFLASCTRTAPGCLTPVGVLFATYQRWCEATGREPVTLTRFGYALSQCGAEKTRINGRVAVVGVTAALAA